MKFEWDETKNQANREKHGLSLEEARAMWDSPLLILGSDHPGEERELAIGKIDGKHWTAIFTPRGGVIRLISARRSRQSERKIYDEKDHRKEP